MITSIADFVYTTPPPNVSVDGDFLGSTAYPNGHALMWQDTGFLIEGCRERNVLCKTYTQDDPNHQFEVDTVLRKSNIVNASWFLHNKYANTASSPARGGLFRDDVYPVAWRGGNPMFVNAGGLGNYLNSSITTLNSHTSYGYITPGEYQTFYDMSNQVYKSYCDDIGTVQRPNELNSSDVTALDSSQIITLQNSIDSLQRVFFCFVNNGTNTTSYSSINMGTLPMICEMGMSIRHLNNTSFAADAGALMLFDTYWQQGQWAQYTTMNEAQFAVFNKDIQDKVLSANVWIIYSLQYYGNASQSLPDCYHIAYKHELHNNGGKVQLADGQHDMWHLNGAYSTSIQMMNDALSKFGLSRTSSNNITLATARSAFADVLFKPNSSLT